MSPWPSAAMAFTTVAHKPPPPFDPTQVEQRAGHTNTEQARRSASLVATTNAANAIPFNTIAVTKIVS